MSTSLDGTRALVTGATSGLGLAMAWPLADAGAAVAVTRPRRRTGGQASATLPGVTGVALDVRDERSVASAADQAWSRLAAWTCW